MMDYVKTIAMEIEVLRIHVMRMEEKDESKRAKAVKGGGA